MEPVVTRKTALDVAEYFRWSRLLQYQGFSFNCTCEQTFSHIPLYVHRLMNEFVFELYIYTLSDIIFLCHQYLSMSLFLQAV